MCHEGRQSFSCLEVVMWCTVWECGGANVCAAQCGEEEKKKRVSCAWKWCHSLVLTLGRATVHLFYQRYHLTRWLLTGFGAKPQCVMGETYPIQHTKGLFRRSGILHSSWPHLADGDCRGNISLSLSRGEKGQYSRGWGVASPSPPLIHLSKCVWLQLQSDLTVRTKRTQSNKTPSSYIHNHSKKESWVSDLLLSFNLLDDIPLVSNVLDFHRDFYAIFPT